jgi:hypothetical protein
MENYQNLHRVPAKGANPVFSLKHSFMGPLAFNLDTLSITPQYFDEWFTIVTSTPIDDQLDPIWSDLFARYHFHYQLDDDDEDIILAPKMNVPSLPAISLGPEKTKRHNLKACLLIHPTE